MKTKNLEAVRKQIVADLTELRLQQIFNSIESFDLTYELIDVEREIKASKIVDLCLTGK